MPHPDPHAPPDRTPVKIGEVWENPVTKERATILELPSRNHEQRVVAELLALVGARVIGEHRHSAAGQESDPLLNDIRSASISELVAIPSMIWGPAVDGSSGIGSRSVGLTLCSRIRAACFAFSSRPGCVIRACPRLAAAALELPLQREPDRPRRLWHNFLGAFGLVLLARYLLTT
jgi:hypothetical protein